MIKLPEASLEPSKHYTKNDQEIKYIYNDFSNQENFTKLEFEKSNYSV